MSNASHTAVGAVIVAAGSSTRMRGIDKVFAPLGGLPTIAHSIATFETCARIDRIVVVLSSPNLGAGRALVAQQGWRKVAAVCQGGARRQDSVRIGLEVLGPCAWVVVHDGARPFVDADLIEASLDAARETGVAIAAVPVKDTIKVVGADAVVQSTPRRDGLWAVQTPQTFRYDLLLDAHRRVTDDVTDDAAMVERLGHRVKVFMGSYRNLKVTTLEDIAIAEALLQLHTQQAPGGHA